MTKACKNCHLLVEEAHECPLCKGTDFSEKFNSMVVVFDAQKSEVAQKLGAKAPGRYAIKVK
jgi:DNA-directed RNA polymerase subunit E"